MTIAFLYALIVGVLMSILVVVGCSLGKRSLVLAGMIFSTIIASPVVTFTRGTAGAIYASDIVAGVLLICWFMGGTQSFICDLKPEWYKWFLRFITLAIISIIMIAPFFSGGIEETGLTGNVSVTVQGIPLPILIAGFRLFRIILYLVFFVYAARMIMDENTFRLVCKLITAGIVILAACQILNFLGIVDLGLFVQEEEWQRGHILGHPKAAAGRLYLLGFFVTLILSYRSWSAFIYLGSLAVIGMGLLVSGSRAAFVGMLVGLLVLVTRLKLLGKILVLIVVALIPLGFYVLTLLDPEKVMVGRFLLLEDPSSNPRWEIWAWIIPYIATHPHIWISGVGFSNFRYALVTEYMGAKAEHAHNDFLTCFTEMGFLGLALFSAYVFSLGRSVFRRMKYSVGKSRWEAVCIGAIFTCFLVTCFFENTFYFSGGGIPMQRMLSILFGTATGWWIQQDYSNEMNEINEELLDSEDYISEDAYA